MTMMKRNTGLILPPGEDGAGEDCDDATGSESLRKALKCEDWFLASEMRSGALIDL